MLKAKYGVGDLIMLRDGPLRHARTEEEFRVVAIMPDAEGQVQYRVRSEVEGFDRRVLASDIDTERSAASGVVRATAAKPVSREPWFKASSIRVHK